MTVIAAPDSFRSVAAGKSGPRWFLSDVAVLAARSLARIAREPETLLNVTVQPVMFVLLFVYVFGGAIPLPGGGSYREFLVGGMLGMGLASTAPATAVALAADMGTGLIDRFRSLPMSQAAVLAGRTVADLAGQVIGTVVVAAVGLAVGWRVHTSAAQALAAFGLALLFGYAFTWLGVCLGMVLRSAEAAQQAGFLLFLPLTFCSSAFVPTQGMPGWLQAVADWNPLSALAGACRQLFGNPDPVAGLRSWPVLHPELTVVLWSGALLVLCAPLAVFLFRRKARG